MHDKLSEHTRDLPPLSIGDAVLVQNQLGNSPRRWDRRGVIVEVLPHRQYKVMMDGSRRISLRNRKFLRKFQRVETSDNNLKNQFTVEPTSRKTETVSSPVINDPTVTQENIPKQVHPMPNQFGTPTKVCTTERMPVCDYEVPDIPEFIPSEPEAGELEPEQCLRDEEHPQPAVPNLEPANIRVEDVIPPITPRRSSRVNKGMNKQYSEYFTGSQFDEATNRQLETIQCIYGNHFHNYSDSQSQIVGYQNSMLPVVYDNSPVQPVYMLEGCSGYGSLYAIPLAPEQQDRKALWTENGWIWL